MSATPKPFEADVGRVLDIVVNSLYRHREVFLRELISNASDACDRLRYLSLSEPELLGEDPEFRIEILLDRGKRLITVRDNGIGMNREELERNLGTIARSGTARFVAELTGERTRDLELIGRFGVGFYAAFMVADRVVVVSRRAGEERGWVWASDGRSGYLVEEAETVPPRGTAVTLHLKADADEFLNPLRIEEVIRRYCDHIAFPIFLEVEPAAGESRTSLQQRRQINRASAIWTRPPQEISDEAYVEFYRHVAHSFDRPYARLHLRMEGQLAWSALLFIPERRPFDLFDPHRRHGVRLYVRRVFVTDGLEGLLPRWLRFVVGVVDSEDLPLNVSRETLQHDAVVAKIRRTLIRRILDELARLAQREGGEGERPSWSDWWCEFGPVLKEGLLEEGEWRERILALARFRTTRDEGWTDLDSYLSRMVKGQKAIYVLTGEDAASLRHHPQLEAARARGIEVLLLDDAVDPFWLERVESYKGHRFVSLAKGEVDFAGIGEAPREEAEPALAAGELAKLTARLKSALGEEVADVRPSRRLADSPACLVVPEYAPDPALERLLRRHGPVSPPPRRILEYNPRHPLLVAMAGMIGDARRSLEFDELARLLLDQARVVEGEPLPDPGAFARRLGRFLARAVDRAAPTAGDAPQADAAGAASPEGGR